MDLSLKKIFSSFQPQPTANLNRVVGIDVGSSSVKVVEFENTDKAAVLRTYGELQLGPYGQKEVGESVKLEQKQLLQAMVDIFREAGVIGRKGVFAIPLSSSFVTVADIIAEKKESLDSRIPVEARKYIPIPLDEVTLDWIELPQLTKKAETSREVLLVAIHNEALGNTSQLLAQVDMVGQPTELEIFSTLRSTIGDTKGSCAVLDLGANQCRLYIVHNGLLVRIHRVGGGGVQITKKIAEAINVPFAEAEVLKRTSVENAEVYGVVHNATTTILNNAMSEFKRVIEKYETNTSLTVEKIFVSGGIAATHQITPYLKDSLVRDIAIVKPFNLIAYPAFMEDTLNALGPSFTCSIGAALRLLQ